MRLFLNAGGHMTKCIVVVTGAGSGFGLDTSLAFARKGYRVYATVRSLSRAQKLQEAIRTEQLTEEMEILEMDITKPKQIESVMKEIADKERKIDILVNNAGFAMAGFSEDLSLEEWREQFETNLFGLVSVTNHVLPIMRKEKKGKIINISSISGRVGLPGISAYAASKHAVEGYSESLRLEMKDFGIDVCLIEPGSYQTNIWNSGKKLAKASQQKESPYYLQTIKLQNYISANKETFGDRKEVIEQILRVARSKYPRLRYIVGASSKGMLLLKKLIPWKWWEYLALTQWRKIK